MNNTNNIMIVYFFFEKPQILSFLEIGAKPNFQANSRWWASGMILNPTELYQEMEYRSSGIPLRYISR